MATHPIVRMGAPILKRPALAVEDPTGPEVAALIADMLESMEAAGGVGLAAPQIGVGLRVVIFEVPEGRSSDGVVIPVTPLINPLIEPLDEETEEAYESCLSVPGLAGMVPRWRRIGYRGFTPEGRLIEREAAGFHARVLQHECDHLDGILYPMRMTDMSTFGFVEELRRPPPGTEAPKEEVEAE